jgi:hypothetical protein
MGGGQVAESTQTDSELTLVFILQFVILLNGELTERPKVLAC